MKRLNLIDFSNLLNETIQKGEQLEQKKINAIKQGRMDLRKSLSHDPFQPVQMTEDSAYYNPYKLADDGGYMPYAPEFWIDQGKGTQSDYLTVKQFYGRKIDFTETTNRFDRFSKSLDTDLQKSALPIGTVHVYKDGIKYKKIAEGRWAPMADNEYKTETGVKTHQRLMGHHGEKAALETSNVMEQHARIKQVLDKKIKQEHNTADIKEQVLGHAHEAMKHMSGGQMPTDMKHRLNQMAEKQDGEHPRNKALESIAKEFAPSKPHNVDVQITVNGKKYNHSFTKVHGQSKTEIAEKVQKQLLQKIPHARIDKVSVNVDKGHITPELQAKIKRREPGKGEQIDLSSDEVEALLRSGKYALISAGKNPNDQEDSKLDDKAISKRYDSLMKDLKDAGYAYSKVAGHYGGKEDSYLVMTHDADREHIKQLGKKYKQDSVIYSEGGKHEMHFTYGPNEGKMHKGEGIDEKAKERDDFYTEIKTDAGKKMKFALNFDFDQLHKSEHLLRLAMKSVLEKMGENHVQ